MKSGESLEPALFLRRARGFEVVALGGAVASWAGAGELGQLAEPERALEASIERRPLR